MRQNSHPIFIPISISADHDLKTLKSVLRRAYLRFYLRPAYLIGLLRRHMRPGLHQGMLFMRLLKG